MVYASFDYRELKDIRPGLLECVVKSDIPRYSSVHLRPLYELGLKLNASLHARLNANRLAIGYSDFFVVLQEPSDSVDNFPFHEMFPNQGLYHIWTRPSNWLSKGQRDIANTIALDVRPF